jgi:hypothetical protein
MRAMMIVEPPPVSAHRSLRVTMQTVARAATRVEGGLGEASPAHVEPGAAFGYHARGSCGSWTKFEYGSKPATAGGGASASGARSTFPAAARTAGTAAPAVTSS